MSPKGAAVVSRAGGVRCGQRVEGGQGGMIRLMGLISEYFVASTDAAAALIDVDSIPSHAVHGGGIEPVVHLGTLEELLTGRTFDEILEDAFTYRFAQFNIILV